MYNSDLYNAQGKRRWSAEGAQGTNKGHENTEGMALVGVRFTDQLAASTEGPKNFRYFSIFIYPNDIQAKCVRILFFQQCGQIIKGVIF